MIYLVFGVVCLALIAVIGFQDYTNRLDRQKLINALIARSADDLARLQVADQTKINVTQETKPPDLIPTESMTDDQWDNYIDEQIN